MARVPRHEIERLVQEVDLAELVRSTGVKLRRQGNDLVGLCPFHDGARPSLVISPSQNAWKCLGASCEGGTVVDWVIRTQKVSLRHAVEILKNGSRVTAPVKSQHSTICRLPSPISSDAEDSVLVAQVVDYYHRTLLDSPEAQAYLSKRGIWDPDAVNLFRLGFANRTLGLRLPGKNRTDGATIRERLTQTGIIRASGHEHMKG